MGVREADECADQGGCRCLDRMSVLLGGGTVGHAIQVVDAGNNPPHCEGFGRIPPQGAPQADGRKNR